MRTRLSPVLWAAVSLWAFALVLITNYTLIGLIVLPQGFATLQDHSIALSLPVRAWTLVLVTLAFAAWMPFTKLTFRRSDSRYWGLVVVVVGCCVSAAYLTLMDSDAFILPYMTSGAARILFGGAGVLGASWLGWESWKQWRTLAPELADDDTLDPLVVNRFLLWACAGMLIGLQFLVAFFMEPDLLPHEQSLLINLFFIAALFGGATLMYLGLAPPKWYRRRFAWPSE